MKYFLEVAKTLSMTKAADSMYISRQNLGFIIKNLENEIGSDLFLRTNTGLKLTADGELFLKYAQQCVSLYEGFLNEKNNHNNILDFYVTSMLSNLVEEKLFGEKLCSEMYLNFHKYEMDTILEMIENNKLGIYFFAINKDGLTTLDLKSAIKISSEENIVSVCHKDNCTNCTDSGRINIISSTITKNIPKNTLNIDNFDYCKRIMKDQGIVLRTTKVFYKKYFSSEEWIVIDERPAIYEIEYVLFVNLPQSSKKRLIEKELQEKLSSIFLD